MALRHEITISRSNRKNFKIKVNNIFNYYYYIMYPDFKYRGESHDSFELFICLSGEVKANVGNEILILKDHEYIIQNKNTFHAHNANKKMATTISFSFNATGLNAKLVCDKVGKFDDTTFSLVEVLTSKVSQYLNNPDDEKPYGYEEFLLNNLESILLNIQSNFLQESKEEKKYIETNRFNKYILDNYQRKLDLDTIANEFNYSVGHLCRKFKNENKMTVVDYITQVRLANAILMMEKDITLSEIAIACGFTDIYSFSKVFKKYMKIAPSLYHKNTIYKKHMHFENIPKSIRDIIELINK